MVGIMGASRVVIRWFQSRSVLALWLRRFAAGGGLSLVLGLTALAASPEAHEHVHCDAHEADHICVVTLYSTGVEDAAEPVFVARPEPIPVSRCLLAATKLTLPAIRFRHPPERGPPTSS